MRGSFITLEGIEGSGKSSQARRLAAHVAARGHRVLALREPGGTPLADAVRSLVLDHAADGMAGETELLLFGAARADHVRRVIVPALEAGTHVVCDRFSDSMRAYQGAGRGIATSAVDAVDRVARGTLVPDVTILLDLDVELGLGRAARRLQAGEKGTRIDDEDLAFHRRVRSGFLRLAKDEPRRIWVVDASPPEDEVAARVLSVIARVAPALVA